MITSTNEQFHGLPVVGFPTDRSGPDTLPEPGAVAWRLSVEYAAEGGFDALWADFLATVDPASVRALVIGTWWPHDHEPAEQMLATLAGDATRLSALEALFIADVTYEDCEISWLEMSDITPVVTAFPQLTELVVRGGNGLRLSPVRHDRLVDLRFEAGGLSAELVRGVAASELPALEGLELWLGVDDHGGSSDLDDLTPFLDGTRLPALRHLRLQNSMFQDEIAAAVAHAPVVARLRTLGLSMGTLTDEGAAALLDGQPLTHLRTLDLHHHYLTDAMQERIRASLPGVAIDLSEPEDPDSEWRYVAVAE
ncbi:STM4015 family protein [Streptomyces sp. BE20]|uniref:STM4015 family protein n=1 Tax=Streptomyces sp. BE20 TaxID=3002525 RepID=UPI002E7947BD|nr:STM4015 family protein [Streptomyces sp. BE20]MEE1824966.1 STM4015 family protein [Streptomyces sp. BE20]